MAGKILTIAQQKGGTGKTTLAAHLAVARVLAGKGSVAIVDLDPQGSLGEWYEARENRLGADGTGLVFRTASGWGAKREAQALARDHDVVVIDNPPHADREGKPAIEAADLVVIPVQPTPVDLWATEATYALASAAGRLSLMVLNRVPPRARLTEDMTSALASLGPVIARARMGNRVAYAASMGTGATVLETAPSGKAAAEMADLALEIYRRAG